MLFTHPGFIFDMDGVIVDSTQTHTDAWKMYLKEHGIEVPDIEARMLGKHNAEIVRDFFSDVPLTDDMIFQHGARKEELYRTIIKPNLSRRIVPGVLSFIERHREAPMAVATNAEPANVGFILDGAGIRDAFRVIVDGHQVKRPKPFPDIYLRAAELLGLAPEFCVVFEDSVTGAQAAHAAGMRVVRIATTLDQIPGVDLMVKDFSDPQLEPWLEETLSVA